MSRARIWSVFIVSMATLAFEVMLTRYFAVAGWEEYGYWVISIAMVGFSLSGVALALFRDRLLKHEAALFFLIPFLLIIAAAAGFHFAGRNAFNPLALQNPVLYKGELLRILEYYLVFFPYFFLAGLLIGLAFTLYQERIPVVYAADLAGAGFGALCALILMFYIHPFYLPCAILPPLAVAALLGLPSRGTKRKLLAALMALCALAGGEVVTWMYNSARIFEYKDIYPILHVEGNQITQEVFSPKGYYLTLDNFTERRDIALSNNVGLLGLEGPPESFGLYRDGYRMAALPKSTEVQPERYVMGTLDALPYVLRDAKSKQSVLVIGSGGGFRVAELASLGARSLTVLETDPVIRRYLAHLPVAELARRNGASNVEVVDDGAQSFLPLSGENFDIVDISAEYLSAGKANAYAFTKEAFKQYFAHLNPDGLASIPIVIQDFPGYALNMARTVYEALGECGLDNAAAHIIGYRSERVACILFCKRPFTQQEVEAAQTFCSDRSFDIMFCPGVDEKALPVWNELPELLPGISGSMDFDSTPKDRLRSEMFALFEGQTSNNAEDSLFNLSSITNRRPFPRLVLRPSGVLRMLKRLDQLPQPETALVVDYCVLAQAILFGLVVALLPISRIFGITAGTGQVARGIVYFACLGLAYMFIEITLIEQFALFLNDNVSSFAVVLTGILVFSGCGSLLSSRFSEHSARTARVAIGIAAVALVIFLLGGDSLLRLASPLPFVGKIVVTLLAIAPFGLAMGIPFPMGLTSLGGSMTRFVPMAWGINGAFSIIASPLGFLLAVSYGFELVLALGVCLYLMAAICFPSRSNILSKEGA